MEATFVDLRTRTREILEALRRNETVELSYRGKRVGVIQPEPTPAAEPEPKEPFDPAKIPGFGMWADREDMKDPAAWVREIRQPRKFPEW